MNSKKSHVSSDPDLGLELDHPATNFTFLKNLNQLSEEEVFVSLISKIKWDYPIRSRFGLQNPNLTHAGMQNWSDLENRTKCRTGNLRNRWILKTGNQILNPSQILTPRLFSHPKKQFVEFSLKTGKIPFQKYVSRVTFYMLSYPNKKSVHRNFYSQLGCRL